MVKLTLLLSGHVPLVVKFIWYVFNMLLPKLTSPVVVFVNTNPEGDELNIPVEPPVICGTGSVPVKQ